MQRYLRPVLRNPTRNQWIGGAVALGVIVGVVYAMSRDDAPAAPKYQQPPVPMPLPGEGEGAPVCNLGPRYPGFVLDGEHCVPGPTTPPGVYITSDCTDFVFVTGEDGPQPDDFETRIANVVTDANGNAVDPTDMVSGFLSAWWPECSWPSSANDSPRIMHLYMALSLMAGRMIVHAGGNVLGSESQSTVDGVVDTRFDALGLPDFDNSIVPEIVLPEFDDGTGPGDLDPGDLPGTGGVGGLDPQDVGQGQQGGIDLPPGGQGPGFDLDPIIPAVAGVFVPPVPPVPPPESLDYKPAPEHLDLISTPWTERYTQHIVLFDFAEGDHALLQDWTIRFGVCLTSSAGFGELTNFFNGQGQQPPADFDDPGALGDPTLRFQIRNVDAVPIQFGGFTSPMTYKKRYAAKFKRGAVVKITQALHEINDWNPLDACPNRQQRWPEPSSPNGFWVMPAGLDDFAIWDPKPRISIIVSGPKIVLKISYVGFPYFQVTGGESKAQAYDSAFKLDLKVSATGTNP